MIDYNNKVVLVTGAASGIGAAITRALAGRGAQVICADRDVDGLNLMVEELGGDARALVCDLSDPTAAEKLIAQVYDIAGRLDLVCSNAGVGYGGRLAKTNYEDPALSRLFEINLFAGLKLAKAYVEQLKDSGATGRLLVTASENSLSVPSAVRSGSLALYGATKHALLIAMEWFRIEQERGPLDVHVLMPGAVYTPLLASNLPDPSLAPPELELIMPEQCADIALKGMDLDLFYIPTQAHLLDDMHPRVNEIESALKALEIEITY